MFLGIGIWGEGDRANVELGRLDGISEGISLKKS